MHGTNNIHVQHSGWKNLNERDHLEDLSTDGRIILECIFEKLGGEVWNGYILLRTETNGRLLWTW